MGSPEPHANREHTQVDNLCYEKRRPRTGTQDRQGLKTRATGETRVRPDVGGTSFGATKKAALAGANAAFIRFRHTTNQPTIVLTVGSFGLRPGKFETVTR